VLEVAGASVLLQQASDDQYVQRMWFEVINIKTGASYDVASRCSGEMCGGDHEYVGATVLSFTGGVIAAIYDLANDQRVVIAQFSPQGARRELDAGTSQEIDVGSLRRNGATTVTWLHSGQTGGAHLDR
jgi:hypothetical protein